MPRSPFTFLLPDGHRIEILSRDPLYPVAEAQRVNRIRAERGLPFSTLLHRPSKRVFAVPIDRSAAEVRADIDRALGWTCAGVEIFT